MRNEAAWGPSGERTVWIVRGVLSNSSGSTSVSPRTFHGFPSQRGRGGQGDLQIAGGGHEPEPLDLVIGQHGRPVGGDLRLEDLFLGRDRQAAAQAAD